MNVNELTMEELEIVEQKSGQSITTLEDPAAPKTKIMRALAWVMLKHENPHIKWDEVGKMSLDQIVRVIGIEEEEDPKD